MPTVASFRRALLRQVRLKLVNQSAAALAHDRAEPPIAVADIMARYSPAGHAAQADAYFEREDELGELFRRPFQNDPSTQQRLFGLSAVLQLLGLPAGRKVLDFGCGLGWLSRCLATMGGDMIAVDVSAKALRLGREWLARDPCAADLRVEFRLFDGEVLPLEDASVDRIVSFDAFHHVLDQAATLREMARVLRPGGCAVFHEPGPEHSNTPDAQSEMRHFGVIENNIDVHALWRHAEAAGFTGIRMTLPQPQSVVLSLGAFERFASGRPSLQDSLHITQHLVNFSYNLRVFALDKAAAPG